MNDQIRIVQSQDGRHRVVIFRRTSGTYGFDAETWDPEEQAWVPAGRYSHAVTATADEAEAQARSRVDWLQAELRG